MLLLSLACTCAQLVFAADFTVESGQTVGGQTLNSGETGTVQQGGAISTSANNDIAIDGGSANNVTAINKGTITTTGDSADGIYTLDNNRITNNGTITTGGIDSPGIFTWDNNSITNNGTITTNGDDSYGMAGRFDNTIVNNGGIATHGEDAYGIYTWDNNSIINNGTITTTGENGDGMDTRDGNTIINNGTISTSGVIADGIDSNDGNTIINNGSIIISGDEDGFNEPSGIEGDNNNTIVNNGSITTSGQLSPGILTITGDNNRITNNGRIITTGDESDGIVVRDDSSVVNHGLVRVSGFDSWALYAENGNTITNSGTLISIQSDAILLDGDNNNVHLLGGTVIQGGIELTEATNSFNYGNGLNTALTFTGNLPGSINTNGMPSATRGMLVATVDTSGFALEDEVVTDITDCGHNGIGLRLSRVRTDSGSGAWGNLCGNLRHQRDSGPAVDARHLLGGVVFGRDQALTSDRRFGWMVGLASSRVEVQYDAQDIDIKSLFGGLYGGRQLADGTFIDLSLLAGYASHDSERRVVNNLVSGGLQTAHADYDGYFVSPGIRLGTNTQWFGHTVQPSLDIRYAGMRLGGYSENGSAADVSADGRTLHSLSTRAKLSFFSEFPVEGGHNLRQESYIGLAGRLNLGNDEADIELLGNSIEFDYGGEDSSLGLIVGFNATLNGRDGAERILAGFSGQLDRDGSIDLSAHINAVIPF